MSVRKSQDMKMKVWLLSHLYVQLLTWKLETLAVVPIELKSKTLEAESEFPEWTLSEVVEYTLRISQILSSIPSTQISRKDSEKKKRKSW